MVLIIFTPVGYCLGQETENPPTGHTRSIPVPTTPRVPTIDGRLDDKAWQNVAASSNFWLPAEQERPTDRTEVLVLSDGKFLYFGFRCYESQPELIRTIKERRDAGLGYDDQVSVELDPFLDRRAVSTYSVSANGIQNDAIAGGRARKIEWKGDWKAAAVRTEYGWSAEMAIPFSILNYDPGASEMGVNFIRYQNRTNEWSYWADVTPQYLKEEMGRLTGLDLPEVAKSRPWTFMPYALVGANIQNIRGETRDKLFSAGADIRYEPRPNLTGVVSLYPDFSQLESQVTNIDFSYTEKYRADPRPFFQEGSAYFGNDRSYFYSNRLPDHYAGAKAFGRWGVGGESSPRSGGLKAGGLVTSAPNDRWDGVLRLVRELGERHSMGMMLVTTNREALDNQLLVAQMSGRESKGFYYDVDLAYSNTQEQDVDHGGAYSGNAGWQEDYWSVDFSADYFDKEYFPANGLLASDRYGTRSLGASTSYYRDYSGGTFRNVSGSIGLDYREAHDGRAQNQNIYISGGVDLHRQIDIDLEYFRGDYRPRDGGPGEFSDTVNRDHYWATNLNFNTRSSVFGYGLYYADGFLGGDDYQYITGYLWGKPTRNTVLNLSSERLENFGTTRQTIANGGWDITRQDGIVARVIWSDDDYRQQRIAYRRTVRAGMDLFAVYEDETDADAQFSVKAVWTFRK